MKRKLLSEYFNEFCIQKIILPSLPDNVSLSIMNWNEIRSAYPDKWLVVEALKAHTDPNNKRILSDLKVIEICSDGISAFNKYRELHKLEPCKEYYYLNTNRVVLEIEERKWVGIRIKSAASNQV